MSLRCLSAYFLSDALWFLTQRDVSLQERQEEHGQVLARRRFYVFDVDADEVPIETIQDLLIPASGILRSLLMHLLPSAFKRLTQVVHIMICSDFEFCYELSRSCSVLTSLCGAQMGRILLLSAQASIKAQADWFSQAYA